MNSTSQATGTYELGLKPADDEACAALLQQLLSGHRLVIAEQIGINHRYPFTRHSGEVMVAIAPAVNSPKKDLYLKIGTSPIVAVPVAPLDYGGHTYPATVTVRDGEVEIARPFVVNGRLTARYVRIDFA
jgi:hypothetical protein